MSLYHEPKSSADKQRRARNLKKLPELAFVDVPDEDVLCVVKRGESGYHRTDWRKGDKGKAFAAERNRRLGVTEAQARAMASGSMFGWHVPAADADHDVNNPGRTPKLARGRS